MGHSRHGRAFDAGPRQKPWRMEGIGHTHMPITTSVPEVQEWFDQGVTLLHGFWYYEAERAFRWCAKLDPECAMAYWGLARAADGAERSRDFLEQASRRKDKVSARERLYIEAEEGMHDDDGAHGGAGPVNDATFDDWRALQEKYIEKIEEIVLKYPDDIEAKALLALSSMGAGSRFGQELIVREILAAQPDHPGAHHYRIHNWDEIDRADQALESCLRFGRIAFNSGHACHMPGHIYSQLGMYHEAAIWMDTAARVEREYMQERLASPQDTWNYPHDVHYLGYLLEQLGMPGAAIANARNLLDIPVDPRNDDDRSQAGGIRDRGMSNLIRALVKFERWDEIRREGAIPWSDALPDKVWKAYCLALAELGAGDVLAARKQLAALRALERDMGKDDQLFLKDGFEIQWREVKGLIRLRENEPIEGLQLLMDAAEREAASRKEYDDPPDYPRVGYNVLGEAYLGLDSPRLAIEAFRKTLAIVPNDGFALSGLTQAYAALGDSLAAADALARLQHVWSNADANLRWMTAAAATGVKPQLGAPALRAERSFAEYAAQARGPEKWEPYRAPELNAKDAAGAPVTLEQLRDSNVLLVFYLGEECPHCMEQLQAIRKREGDFQSANVKVLAISSAPPERNAASAPMKDFGFMLLSDGPDHVNARRFHAYDDFEDLELHATILIDRQGRVQWMRCGGDPFMDLDLLLKEIKRFDPRKDQETVPVAARPKDA